MKYINLRETSSITKHGFCMSTDSETFSRMDTDVALEVALEHFGHKNFDISSLYSHARESAGGRIRFRTDSSVISIKVTFSNYICEYAAKAFGGRCGFDVYTDTLEGSLYCGMISPKETDIPTTDGTWSYEEQLKFDKSKPRNITIFFPILNEIADISIGVDEDAYVTENEIHYDNAKQIVYYGSSITQGQGATSPSKSYVNVIGRMLGRDYINLGACASAHGQAKVAEYIAKLEMSVFVFDYDHNAPSAEHLKKTQYPFYQIVRRAHPDIPIIFITRPNQCGDYLGHREVIKHNYHLAAASDKNVYFIDGQTFFEGEDGCLADGVHPTDKGYAIMAREIGGLIADILGRI